MTAITLDGTLVAGQLKVEVASRVQQLRERGISAGLGTLLVGDDPGSKSYVAGKHRDCAEVGIESIRIDLPATAPAPEIIAAIAELNSRPEVTGYIVQLPLPDGIDENAMLELIDPDKDADGLHPMNLGRLVLGVSGPITSPLPCTPAGIVELLDRYDVPISGKHVVVLGRGLTVGRPLGLLLTRKGIDATVTLTHSRTTDVEQYVRDADIVIAAVGVPALVKPDWVKPGCRGARRGHHAGRESRHRQGEARRRRRSWCGRGRRLAVTRTGWRRPDDPGAAAEERGGCGGALVTFEVDMSMTTGAPTRTGIRLGTLSLIVAGFVVVFLVVTVGLFVIGYESRWTNGAIDVSMATLAASYAVVPLGFVASLVLGILAITMNRTRGRVLGGIGIAVVVLASGFHFFFLLSLLFLNN